MIAGEQEIEENRDQTLIQSQSQTVENWVLSLTYQADGDNLWTQELLPKIKEFEDWILAYGDTDKFCELNDGECFVLGVVGGLAGLQGEEFSEKLKEVYSGGQIFFGIDIEEQSMECKIGRSLILMAAPISVGAGFESITDDFDKQEEEYKKFVYDLAHKVNDMDFEGFTPRLFSVGLIYAGK